jgi:hypothetical protein
MTRPGLSLATLARASAVHVAVAFVGMGGWALFANRAHGVGAIGPALAQGTMSGLITLILKRALEAFAARLSGWIAYGLAPLITASVILAVLIAVHTVIGTPEIAATIAVPWGVSTLYAVVYTAALARGRRGRSG